MRYCQNRKSALALGFGGVLKMEKIVSEGLKYSEKSYWRLGKE